MIQYLRVLHMSPGRPRRKIFISEISIQRSGKGKGGDSELCGRKGKAIFFALSLSAAGRVLLVPDPWVPSGQAGCAWTW